MFKKLLLGSWVLVAVLVSSSAIAGNYWGFGLGNASFDLKPLNGAFELEDGTAFKFLWGNRNGDLGMEAEISFSDHDWKGSGGLASHFATNIVLSGIGYLPVADGFDLYGKGGLNFSSTTVDLLGETFDGESGIGLALGAGVEFTATEQFHIRLEYQMLNGLDDGIDEGDISQMTVSGTYFY